MDRLTEKAILEAISKDKSKLQTNEETKEEPKQEKLNFVGLIMTLVILITITFVIGALLVHRESVYAGRVHWQAQLNITVCGQEISLCDKCGTKPFTLINQTLHVVGPIKKKEDMQLGKFFDSINVTFTEDKILNYTNCNGQPAKIKMTVNDKPREDYGNYTINPTLNPKEQIIKIKFDTETG